MARYLSRAELSCIAGKYIEMYYGYDPEFEDDDEDSSVDEDDNEPV